MDKTIRILLSFGDGDWHGVRDIARDLSLPRSTVSRLILDLAETSLITQDPSTGQYRLGVGVARLGQVFLDGLDLRTVALPIMAQLQQDTIETVGLHIRERLERIVIASAESRATIRSSFSIGERLPLHAGAGGKVLLAFEPEEQQSELIAGLNLTPLTDRTIVDPDQLSRELAAIREQGYATSANEVSQQSASLAAPVFVDADRPAAALVVTGPVFRMTPEVLKELAPRAVAAAKDISIRMGYVPRSERR